MTTATARGAFPYPVIGDADNPPAHIQALADRLAAIGAIFTQGTDAARIAATKQSGLFWWTTDGTSVGHKLWYCDGATWFTQAVDVSSFLTALDAAATYLSQADADTTFMPLGGGVFTGQVDHGDEDTPERVRFAELDQIAGRKIAGGTSGTLTLKRGQTVVQSGNATGNITLAWAAAAAGGPIDGYDCMAAVLLKMGATPRTLSVPAGSKWLDPGAPTIVANKWYMVHLYTDDGGATTLISVGAFS